MLTAGAAHEAERVLALLLRYGSHATSFQTAQSGYRYFFHGSDGYVAYVETGGAWVAAGAPVTAPEAQSEVVAAFLAAARKAGRRACFFATEQPLESAHGQRLKALAIGEQPVWDPRTWPELLRGHRSLREQLRRARKKGVSTRQTAPSELERGAVREQMERVCERWLGTRAMAPMAFLVRLEPFDFTAQRRTFVAEQNGRIVGFAGVVPVPSRNGWFLEALIKDPAAPNGTGELLVHAVMQWAGQAECAWVTLGLSPLSGALPTFLHRVRRSTRLLYDFAGLRAYKAKFRPQSWQPVYLCYPEAQPPFLSLADTLRAFAHGSLVRFGFRTLLRGPTVALNALGLLLVPWTLLLAMAPSERWFGTGWAKWSWVGFDIAVALGLWRLLRKGEPFLLTALAITVTFDAVLTMLEALVYNARHVQGVLEFLVLPIACAGPTLAAVVLWGARRHRLRLL